jgi:hypothetical protein
MQSQPTAGDLGSSCSVRGLGVTDALQLGLDGIQVPWLIDELDELRGVYEDELHHAAGRHPDPGTGGDEEVLERTHDQLRTLRMLRAQLPASDDERRVTFVGPTALVLDIVAGAVRNVVAALSEPVQGGSRPETLRGTRAFTTPRLLRPPGFAPSSTARPSSCSASTQTSDSARRPRAVRRDRALRRAARRGRRCRRVWRDVVDPPASYHSHSPSGSKIRRSASVATKERLETGPS